MLRISIILLVFSQNKTGTNARRRDRWRCQTRASRLRKSALDTTFNRCRSTSQPAQQLPSCTTWPFHLLDPRLPFPNRKRISVPPARGSRKRSACTTGSMLEIAPRPSPQRPRCLRAKSASRRSRARKAGRSTASAMRARVATSASSAIAASWRRPTWRRTSRSTPTNRPARATSAASVSSTPSHWRSTAQKCTDSAESNTSLDTSPGHLLETKRRWQCQLFKAVVSKTTAVIENNASFKLHNIPAYHCNGCNSRCIISPPSLFQLN